MSNVTYLHASSSYRKRAKTATDSYACEVIVMLDDSHDLKVDMVDLVKRCLGYNL